ncbi:hypothetical protein [Cupriavidus sp. D39]|uniref:hypothetical protein n=1 Tax=Cupriavidus sp. D39 TaxID=2997877 RepID=UPI00226D9804|nr:hypothetical protein [Cupriavidus sp. D39]MCY0855087.1 hypothetical protein [Cupriavidus sp. D39]
MDSRGAFAYVGHYGVQTYAHEGLGGHEVFVVDIARGEHVASLDCAPITVSTACRSTGRIVSMR